MNEFRIRTINHPVKSPDLNIIENIWSDFKRRVEERGPHTIREMEAYSQEEWKKTPIQLVQNCILTMPKWIRKVCDLKGASLKV